MRAIFASALPVITGIVHEPDFSLADATADIFASTPTAAAEAAVGDVSLILEALSRFREQLFEEMEDTLLFYEQSLDQMSTAIIDYHDNMLSRMTTNLAHCQEILMDRMAYRLDAYQQKLTSFAATLDAFSPLKTLNRGYAIVQTVNGRVVRSIKDVTTGETIDVTLSDGTIQGVVT